MGEWTGLIQTFGVSVVILVFIAWASTKIAPWFAARLDKLIDKTLSAAEKVEKFDDRITGVEGRIDNLWDFQLRRAAVEAMSHGIGKMNSPIVINEEAKQWLGELSIELKSFYRKLGRTLSNAQLAEEIERRFGDEIVKKVCVPHGLFQGACLLIAMQVAREKDEREV